ncbi:GNAT family N-acetyltransferase [Streptomyces sp. NPDC058964]|uniref:GNAT family N-acetyltransferase n=1 Tax=Streptomyces sp. NPDC058964 TaxID=3346681 RepID=UPI00369C9EBF
MPHALVPLRTFSSADSELLASWVTSPTELLIWAGQAFVWPLAEEQLASYAAESMSPGRRSWTGLDQQTGRAVGHASIRLDADGISGRLGRVLVAPEARGRGVGAAMLKEVLSLAFGALRLQQVELGVFSHNTGAVRLYERLGFRTERVLPSEARVDGQSWAAAQMILAKKDWSSMPTDG